MNKHRNNNEISQIYTFMLGGYLQKVLIEGKNKNLPIVITLHGGPGSPIPFSVGCRGMFPNLTDKFIMVYWDQLGCGINNHRIDDSFRINDFVAMTCDLLSEIKRLFPNNKLYIFATSWGSVLSALVTNLKSNEISGVITFGQIIKNIFFNKEVIETLAKNNIPRKKLDELKEINSQNATSKELKLVSSCLMKYTNAYSNKNGKKFPIFPIIKGLLTSPDYKFKDFKAIMINGYRENNSIWEELLKINLTEVLSNTKIPYIIIQGDTDIVASTEIAKNVVKKANNNNLKIHIVKDTGHIPGVDMIDEILQQMLKLTNSLKE